MALTAAIKICHFFPKLPFSFLFADKTLRKDPVDSGLQVSFLPCNGQPGASKKLTQASVQQPSSAVACGHLVLRYGPGIVNNYY